MTLAPGGWVNVARHADFGRVNAMYAVCTRATARSERDRIEEARRRRPLGDAVKAQLLAAGGVIAVTNGSALIAVTNGSALTAVNNVPARDRGEQRAGA